jgi:prephenate dehydrogenase
LVIVCTPVGRIVADVRAAAAACKPGALITDVGSTKASIVAGATATPAPGVTFVGSHPIAGSEKSGPAAAMRNLFEGRTTVVTPAADTPEKATRAIERFWKTLGSRVVRMSPEAHDAALAATSHVPHVAASALAGATPADVLHLTAGGWLDSTRIAAADTQLWSEILTDNRDHVLKNLAVLEDRLAAFRRALQKRDATALAALLEEGKARRESLRSRPKVRVRSS